MKRDLKDHFNSQEYMNNYNLTSEDFLTRLKELENQGKIEILKVKRLFFRSLYMDGFSYIIWRLKDA